MKCKVKKIPKYYNGSLAVKMPDMSNFKITTKAGVAPQNIGSGSMNTSGKTGGFSVPTGAITSANESLKQMFGVESNSNLGVWADETAKWTEVGGSILPGWGHLGGAIVGTTIGLTKSGEVDENTGEISYGGFFGHSNEYL